MRKDRPGEEPSGTRSWVMMIDRSFEGKCCVPVETLVNLTLPAVLQTATDPLTSTNVNASHKCIRYTIR
jgi:hypothetical protein